MWELQLGMNRNGLWTQQLVDTSLHLDEVKVMSVQLQLARPIQEDRMVISIDEQHLEALGCKTLCEGFVVFAAPPLWL